MIKFLTRHPEKIYIPLLEHIQLVFLTLVISVAIASILTLLCMRSERLSIWLQQLLAVVYSIPSLALFAILEHDGLFAIVERDDEGIVLLLQIGDVTVRLYDGYNALESFHLVGEVECRTLQHLDTLA